MKNVFAKRFSKKIKKHEAKRYHEKYLKACRDRGESEDHILKSLKINADSVRAIIDQEGCVEVRMYLCMPDDKASLSPDCSLILVGVDQYNKNIFKTGKKDGLDDDEIYDNCTPCPTDCPTIPDWD